MYIKKSYVRLHGPDSPKIPIDIEMPESIEEFEKTLGKDKAFKALESWYTKEVMYQKRQAIKAGAFKGNVKVTVTEHEVRVWVCDETGQNIFRFKALGDVYHAEGSGDYTVIKSR